MPVYISVEQQRSRQQHRRGEDEEILLSNEGWTRQDLPEAVGKKAVDATLDEIDLVLSGGDPGEDPEIVFEEIFAE